MFRTIYSGSMNIPHVHGEAVNMHMKWRRGVTFTLTNISDCFI